MRKGDDGEEKREKKRGGGERKKIMMKIVATNVVASQPPERRPTATPTAHAKINKNERRTDTQILTLKPQLRSLQQLY